MIIVDYSQIALSNIIVQKIDDKDLIRHMILNSLRMYNKKYRDEYGQMVLACDGFNTWRKDFFPEYKAARKKNRSASDLDWNNIFTSLNETREEIRDHLPWKVLHLDGTEADDIIATLTAQTQEFGQHEDVMIISADKDFAQLQKFNNISQYSPMLKKYIKVEHPRKQLLEMILRGDTSDGVPNVLSGDNVFVDEIRQTPLRQKVVDQLIEDPSSQGPEVLRNIQRNRLLIDLQSTPKTLKEEIINTFNGQDKWSNKGKVLPFLIEKRCRRLVDDIGDFI